ncbi:MAG: heterodisulfide reductase-related iron-sulfur binding cluster [Candidatus Bathyarchaeia archaeon]
MNKLLGIEHFNFVEDLEPLIYIMTLITLTILLYGFYRKYSLWTYGGQKIQINLLPKRFLRLIIYGVLTRKVIMQKQGGLIHLFIYVGMIGLLIGTLLRLLEYDVFLRFFHVRMLEGNIYLVFKLLMNIFGILALIGITFALLRRKFKTYRNLPTSKEDYLILSSLFVIVLTGFLLTAINTLYYRLTWINNWDLIGFNLALVLRSIDMDYALLYRAIWLLHLILALAMIASIFFTKLSHILISGVFNTFLSRVEEPVIATYKPVTNLDKIIEEGGAPGVSRLSDFSLKMRIDLHACTQCARCHNNCPATLTGKPLSPMNLISSLEGELNKRSFEKTLIGEIVNGDSIWTCLTCGACVRACPVMINPLEIIIDFRRNMTSLGKNVPIELQRVLYNIMRVGNPYAYNPNDREEWLQPIIKELQVEYAQKGREYEYVLWLGCNANYDPNIRKIAYSLMLVLKRANINFAILPNESCCGEPVRRIGDEILFSEIVKKNSEILKEFTFKKLLVMCPHGYTIFKHEYKLYGGLEVEVEHHTTLLQRLIKEGRIKVKRLMETVTYHDPCYLARWNKIFKEPREVIKSIAQIKEMRKKCEDTFCCGAGGGSYFYTLRLGERVSKVRVNEATLTGANKIITACPFCNLMLRSEFLNEKIEVIDLSELVSKSMS